MAAWCQGGQNRLTVAYQKAAISNLFPGFQFSMSNQHTASWSGTLQVFDEGVSYSVSITLNMFSNCPTVCIQTPVLRKDAPHRYPDGSLCLYYPWDDFDKRWHNGSFIAKTIIPWTAGWLFWYELWLETGEWFGPDAHASIARIREKE